MGAILASDRHLQLGADKFELDFRFAPPRHSYPKRDGTRQDIAGSPSDRNLEQGVLLMKRTNWTGGEGDAGENKNFFDSQRPTIYDNGTANTRLPRQLSGPPSYTDSSTAPTTVSGLSGPLMVNGHGYLWSGGEHRADYTNDLVTWTGYATGWGGTSFQVVSMCADAEYVYAFANTVPGGNGTGEIRRFQVGAATGVFAVATANTVDRKLAVLEDNLYEWNGAKLWKLATSSGIPYANINVGGHVYQPGPDGTPPAGATYDIVSTDTNVCFFTANGGQTLVYKYVPTPVASAAGSPLWILPNGFTGRCISWMMGNLFIAGDYDGEAVLFALPFNTLVPRSGRFIRRQTALVPTSMAPGQGNQLLIGMQSGEVFIYDLATDGISYLDSRTGVGNQKSVATYKGKRVAGFATTATNTFNFRAWSSDKNSSTRSWEVIDAAWQFDIPEESKSLLGVHLEFEPFTVAETLTFSYKFDNETNWHDSTITTATSGATTGYVYLPIATDNSTPSGRLLRIKYAGTNGAKLYDIVPRVSIINYQETFQFYIKLEDEHFAPSGRDGQSTVQLLKTYLSNKRVLALYVGWENPLPNTYDQFSVTLEAPTDIYVERITQGPGGRDLINGYALITARSVTP